MLQPTLLPMFHQLLLQTAHLSTSLSLSPQDATPAECIKIVDAAADAGLTGCATAARCCLFSALFPPPPSQPGRATFGVFPPIVHAHVLAPGRTDSLHRCPPSVLAKGRLLCAAERDQGSRQPRCWAGSEDWSLGVRRGASGLPPARHVPLLLLLRPPKYRTATSNSS